MLDRPLQQIPLVFLDFETTGLHPHRGDRVCEVALQRVVGDTVELSFATLVDPERPLSAQSFSVNGIGAAELAGAPKFAEIAGQLSAALAGAVIVAHNAPFDLEFLQAELALAGHPQLLIPTIDTLTIARRLLPKRSSHSLGALALALGAQPPSHRAMDDVLALRAVFADLTAQLAEQGVTTLGDLLRYARGFNPGDPEPLPPPAIADALRDGQLLRVVYRSRTLPEPTARLIRPIEIVKQREALFLRAYCYLRQDLRVFLIDKLIEIELAAEQPQRLVS
jgi:DNA polymerase-3 subunit epsilon